MDQTKKAGQAGSQCTSAIFINSQLAIIACSTLRVNFSASLSAPYYRVELYMKSWIYRASLFILKTIIRLLLSPAWRANASVTLHSPSLLIPSYRWRIHWTDSFKSGFTALKTFPFQRLSIRIGNALFNPNSIYGITGRQNPRYSLSTATKRIPCIMSSFF